MVQCSRLFACDKVFLKRFLFGALSLSLTSKYSATGTPTRVARVRAEYPNQLDYSGVEKIRRWHSILLQAFGLSARSRTLTSPGQTGPPQ